MGQATLMFGIGATKAGTSWLYRYLRSHPECRMPAVKELHYFNTTDAEAIQLQAANLNSKADKFLSQSEDHDGVRKLNTLMSSEEYRVASEVIKSDREGHSAYREFLLDSATEDGAKLAGDITPAYALLPEETLREMSDLTSETRFLYIMRDPVDRLWSNIRMNASRRLEEGRSLNEFSNTILERVVKRGQHPALMQRSDYASTLEKLDNAVPESNRKVLFFERLFFDSTIRDICGFLGISYHPADLEKKVHAGRSTAMRPDLKIAARALLDDQYKAVERRFGDLPVRWKRDMTKVAG